MRPDAPATVPNAQQLNRGAALQHASAALARVYDALRAWRRGRLSTRAYQDAAVALAGARQLLHELEAAEAPPAAAAAPGAPIALAPAHYWRWRALAAEQRIVVLTRDRAQLVGQVQALEAGVRLAELHADESRLWDELERVYGLDRRRNYSPNDDGCSVTPA